MRAEQAKRVSTFVGRVALAAAAAVLSVALVGCSKTRLSFMPLGADQPQLEQGFEQVAYRAGDAELELALASSSVMALGQVGTSDDNAGRATGGGIARRVEQRLFIKVYWLPVAGRTSTDPSSTNAVLWYIVRYDGQYGFYRGAGFVQVKTGRFGRLRARIKHATLSFASGSPTFTPPFREVVVSGRLWARPDEQAVRRLWQQVQRMIERTNGTAGRPASSGD